MRRFRFPLERLERLRHHHEKIARRQFADRLAVVTAIEADLAVIDANLEVCRSEDRRANSLGEALQFGLLSSRRKLEQKLAQAETELEAARVQFAERRRDSKTLNNLHERRLEAWRAEVAREEQAELDEVARIRFSANQREEATR